MESSVARKADSSSHVPSGTSRTPRIRESLMGPRAASATTSERTPIASWKMRAKL
jgi:hypothetical protein